MNQYVTDAVIKELREKNGLTQAMLAKKLCVSDKTISKWETAKFYVCPVCGNVIHSIGAAVIHCHGVQLCPAFA